MFYFTPGDVFSSTTKSKMTVLPVGLLFIWRVDPLKQGTHDTGVTGMEVIKHNSKRPLGDVGVYLIAIKERGV